jgi:DNA-binding response OmpR family regulator
MADKSTHLTPTEVCLLACLVRNAGRIVDYWELLEAMSSRNPSYNIDNLQQCISRLRKKIEIDPALPRVIITHHGQGHSFAGKEEAR